MTSLYLENANSILANNVLYMEHKNWENSFLYEHQGAKLPGIFGSLSDSVATALGIMKKELPTRAVIVLGKRR